MPLLAITRRNRSRSSTSAHTARANARQHRRVRSSRSFSRHSASPSASEVTSSIEDLPRTSRESSGPSGDLCDGDLGTDSPHVLPRGRQGDDGFGCRRHVEAQEAVLLQPVRPGAHRVDARIARAEERQAPSSQGRRVRQGETAWQGPSHGDAAAGRLLVPRSLTPGDVGPAPDRHEDARRLRATDHEGGDAVREEQPARRGPAGAFQVVDDVLQRAHDVTVAHGRAHSLSCPQVAATG